MRGHHPQQWARSREQGAALMGATVCGQPAARKGACFLRAGVEKQSIQPMANAKEFFVLWQRRVQAFLKRTQGKELFIDVRHKDFNLFLFLLKYKFFNVFHLSSS